MSSERSILVLLLILQVIAVIVYPPSFFRSDPQSIVLPPALFLLMALAFLGINTGALNPTSGRVSLVFIQGVNVIVRLIMLFANLRTPAGAWDWPLILAMLIGIVLSWIAIVRMEKSPPRLFVIR